MYYTNLAAKKISGSLTRDTVARQTINHVQKLNFLSRQKVELSLMDFDKLDHKLYSSSIHHKVPVQN